MLTPVSEIKRVRVDTLDMGDMSDMKSRAIVEILLELADDNLEVLISDTELRVLLDIYMKIHQAAPFTGLRELMEKDIEVELFFQDLRELVLVKEAEVREELWKDSYKALCAWVTNPARLKYNFGELSEQAKMLVNHARECLVLEYQIEIHEKKITYAKTYEN